MDNFKLGTCVVQICARKKDFGSGFVFLPDINSEVVYVLTAKHCLFASNFQAKTTFSDIVLFFGKDDDKEAIEYNLTETDEIISDAKNDPDLALLKIDRKKIEDLIGPIPVSYVVEYNGDYLSDWIFKGFPHFNENKPVSDTVSIIAEDSQNGKLEVSSKTPYGNETTFKADNVKGFSGSALVQKMHNQLYILGIVIKYKIGNKFKVVTIASWLKEKIEGLFIYDIVSESQLPWSAFNENILIASEQLGPRYSPLLNVELEIERYFSTISYDHKLKLKLEENFRPVKEAFTIYQSKLESLYKSTKTKIDGFRGKDGALSYIDKGETFEDIKNSITLLLEDINIKLIEKKILVEDIDFPELLRKLYERAYGLTSVMHFLNASIIKGKAYYIEALDACNDFGRKAEMFLGSADEFELANYPFLLIHGEAGSGKSHLFADVANSRIKAGKPTLLFLGQNFNSGNDPWKQIIMQFNLKDISVDDFLQMLNEKGRLMGERFVILIDAINEGQGLGLWPFYIENFVKKLENNTFIALAISYRTTYEPVLNKDRSSWKNFTTIKHEGFKGYERQALLEFSKFYKVELPSVPVLTEEFANPLFLKLICLGLQRDYSLMRDGKIDLDNIFAYYVSFVNEKLGVNDKYDYAYHKLNLVERVVKNIAREMLYQRHIESMPYEKAFDITQTVVGKFLLNKRFLDDLISENIFIDEIVNSDDFFTTYEYYIAFAYQRLGDHFRAKELISLFLSKERKDIVFNRRLLRYYLKDESTRQENQGLVNAVSIIIADKFEKDFYTLLPDDIRNQPSIVRGLLYSFLWRRKDVSLEVLKDIVGTYYENAVDNLYAFWDVNLAMTFNSQHNLNANFLHEILFNFSMADRDSTWSVYLSKRYFEDGSGSVDRLIRWAFDVGIKEVDSQAVKLGTLSLGWFLSSPDRRLRDLSTKALINVFFHFPELLRSWMTKFEGVNDLYVWQRVYAVALGVIVRLDNIQFIKPISDFVYEYFYGKDEIYPDILLRDYARLIITFAKRCDDSLPYDLHRVNPPYTSFLPQEFPTNEEIEKIYKENETRPYGGAEAILSSMVTEFGRGVSRYGDFGRYVFESALRAWDGFDSNGLSNLAIKWIFTKYGYNEEQHGEFDLKLEQGRSRGYRNERIGKKYQWIAFYEILAKVADNYPDFNGKGETINDGYIYKGPWNPYVRDIDPTYLGNITKKDKLGWIKKYNYSQWNVESNLKWLRNKDTLPDPLSFVEIVDSDGRKWLSLEVFPSWNSRLDSNNSSFSTEYKDFFLQIRSYIVQKADYVRIVDRLKTANFFGRWMPESSDRYTMFNREYYWSTASQDYINEEAFSEVVYRRKILGKVSITTLNYLWEEEFDLSKDQPISIVKPSTLIYNMLNLKDGIKDGEFVNENGNLVCFDPSVSFEEDSQLLIDKDELLKKLDENNLCIFWTVLGEKKILNNNSLPMELSGIIEVNWDTEQLSLLKMNIKKPKQNRK